MTDSENESTTRYHQHQPTRVASSHSLHIHADAPSSSNGSDSAAASPSASESSLLLSPVSPVVGIEGAHERRHRTTATTTNGNGTVSAVAAIVTAVPTAATATTHTLTILPTVPSPSSACTNRDPSSISSHNVLLLSVSFMLLFTAFNTVQSFVTSLLPDHLGTISLCLCYTTVVVVVLFTPLIVEKLGEPLSMCIGMICYIVYILNLIFLNRYLLMICSVILGFGNSLLWVANGSYLTRCGSYCSSSERSRQTSIFWSIFQLSSIFGNMLAYMVFTLISPTQLFLLFAMIAIVGMMCLMGLKPLPLTPTSTNISPSSSLVSSTEMTLLNNHKKDSPASLASISSSSSSSSAPLLISSHLLHRAAAPPATVFSLFLSSPFNLLFPLFFIIGFSFSYWNGQFTQMIPNESIGAVLMIAGVMDVAGGTVAGWMSNRSKNNNINSLTTLTTKYLTHSNIILFGALIYIYGLYHATYLMHNPFLTIQPTWDQLKYHAFIAAGCFGTVDAIYNTQVYTLLGVYFSSASTSTSSNGSSSSTPTSPSHTTSTSTTSSHASMLSFTLYNFIQNIGMSFGFALMYKHPQHGVGGEYQQVWLQVVIIGIAMVALGKCEKMLIAGKVRGTSTTSATILTE